jgi:hypothetical protein
MNTMCDREEVLRLAIACAEAHGVQVRKALADYVAGNTPAAEDNLRTALLAQAQGFEATAADGATFAARVEAAKGALNAWDGDTAARCVIEVGARRLRCSRKLATLIGCTVYEDGATRTEARHSLAALAQALTEGLDGEAAALRAVALLDAGIRESVLAQSREKVAKDEANAAGMRLAAEREANRRQGGRS